MCVGLSMRTCLVTELNLGCVQKNPHTVRMAEEKRPTETLSMNVAVNVTLAWQLSALIYNMCSVARDGVYTREADMRHWLDTGKCF